MTALRYFAAPAVGVALFVGDCASERHEEIPLSALMTVEGNKRLAYEAPHDGRLYIYDQNADRMVYQGTIEKGSMVIVDPNDDRVTINGRTVAEKEAVGAGHNHRIFFQEEEIPGEITVPAGSRIEVEPQPAPETKIEVKETDEPQSRIEVQTEDQPDTRINVDTDNADTEIKVD